LTPEVGCCGAFPLIAPPRVADQALAGQGDTGERFDIARFMGESSEKPSLGLGGELGPHSSPERSLRAKEAFVDGQSCARSVKGAAARRVQE
jgi:hypothetical protein